MGKPKTYRTKNRRHLNRRRRQFKWPRWRPWRVLREQ